MGTWYVYSGYPAVHNAEQKCQTEVYEKKGENIVEMKSSSYYTKYVLIRLKEFKGFLIK